MYVHRVIQNVSSHLEILYFLQMFDITFFKRLLSMRYGNSCQTHTLSLVNAFKGFWLMVIHTFCKTSTEQLLQIDISQTKHPKNI